MTQTIYLNGKFVEDTDARISIHDRGFLYGDGLFDTMRAYDGVPFRIEDHIERLLASAEELGIKVRLALDDFRQIARELLDKNNLKDAYLRITITRGEHKGDLSFDHPGPPTILVVARPVKTPSTEEYERGVAACLVHGINNPPELARHKTTSYLPYLFALDKARKSGAREAILVDNDGMILESATGNVFVVYDDSIVTPPLSAGFLPGIARNTVLELAHTVGIEAREDSIAVKDLLTAREIFITNSIVEILPVNRIDENILSDRAGTVARLIAKAYKEDVQKYISACRRRD